MQKAVSNKPHEPWVLISHRQTPRRRLTIDAAIHTLSAQLSVATVETSLALDALGWIFGLRPLMTAGCWMLVAGAGFATVGAFAGLVARSRWQRKMRWHRRIRPADTEAVVRRHAYLCVFFYALLTAMMVWRAKLQAQAGEGLPVGGWYLLVMGLVSIVMIWQVWLGGEVAVRLGLQQEES